MPNRVKLTACLASALFLSTAAHAAPRAEDRALCESHATEDRAACLREAGAARQAARRGELDEGAGAYEKNKLARCSYLPDADRPLCERRMRGEGMVSGTVEGGGIYRELTVTVPAEENTSGAGAPSTGSSAAPRVNSVTGK